MKITFILLLLVTCCKMGESLFDDVSCGLKWPNCGITIHNVGKKNIVCERGETCPTDPGCEYIKSDPEFLKWILNEHNRLRNEIALGIENRNFTGPAANMMALSYDKDLETSAACYANRCMIQHDKCIGTNKFPEAGQNLFYTTVNESDLKKAVSLWFKEINYNTNDVIDKYPEGRFDIAHFTQVIWATTTHVGCSVAKVKDHDYFLTCNYGTKGNIAGESVYKRGVPCSNCPHNTKCNTMYKGLCGDIDESQITNKSGEKATKKPIEFAKSNSGNTCFVCKYFVIVILFLLLCF